MEKLRLTRLEMHLIANLYGTYVKENPIEDELDQKHRDELAEKLAAFSNQFFGKEGVEIVLNPVHTAYWTCAVCQKEQRRYDAKMQVKLVGSDEVMTVCASCHKQLTRDKQIAMEYL